MTSSAFWTCYPTVLWFKGRCWESNAVSLLASCLLVLFYSPGDLQNLLLIPTIWNFMITVLICFPRCSVNFWTLKTRIFQSWKFSFLISVIISPPPTFLFFLSGISTHQILKLFEWSSCSPLFSLLYSIILFYTWRYFPNVILQVYWSFKISDHITSILISFLLFFFYNTLFLCGYSFLSIQLAISVRHLPRAIVSTGDRKRTRQSPCSHRAYIQLGVTVSN